MPLPCSDRRLRVLQAGSGRAELADNRHSDPRLSSWASTSSPGVSRPEREGRFLDRRVGVAVGGLSRAPAGYSLAWRLKICGNGPIRRLRVAIRPATVLALALVLTGAATQLINKFQAPTWLFVALVVIGVGIALASTLQTASSSAEQARKDWRHRLSLLLAEGPPVPCVRDVPPYGSIGVSRSNYSERSGLDKYIPRSVDAELRKGLRSTPFVLVIGEAKSGKTRTAYEAAVAVCGDHRLVVPGGEPRNIWELSLLQAPPDIDLPDELRPPLDGNGPALIWLDDAERFLRSGVLGPELLDRWSKLRHTVLATMRSDELADRGREGLDRSARLFLNRAHAVILPTYPDAHEVSAAKALYPDETFEDTSIGAQLVSARDLVLRFELGRSRHPVGVALVKAAADWRRAGGGRTIGGADLKEIVLAYVDHTVPVKERYEEALAWACEELDSHVALLSPVTGQQDFRVFDYMVTYIHRSERPDQVIPDTTWRVLLRRASASGINLRFEYGRGSESVAEFLSDSLRPHKRGWNDPPASPPPHSTTLLNRARTHLERYFVTAAVIDLDECVSLLREAVGLLAPSDPDLTFALVDLATSLAIRHELRGSANDLHDAISSLEYCATLLGSGSPETPGVLVRLGTLLRDRYVASPGDSVDLERSIEYLQSAVLEEPPSSLERSRLLRELARSRRAHYEVTQKDRDLARSIATYREAINSGLTVSPPDAVQSAREFGDWMSERVEWRKEAAESYALGLDAMLDAIRQGGLYTEHQSWLRAAEGLPSRAAFAFVRDGQLERAAVALELGRSLLLIEALEEHPAVLAPLGAVDEVLLAEYRRLRARNREALTQRHGGDALTGVGDSDGNARFQSDLDAVLLAIRISSGYGVGLTQPSFSDIRASADVPLVYIAATPLGGIGVIVQPPDVETGVCAVTLASLTESDLLERKDANMHELTNWLGIAVMQPILELLGPARRVVLIPLGRLASLPLHAAVTAETDTGSPNRCAIDELAISYAPSALARHTDDGPVSGTSISSMLVVDPAADLPSAHREAAAVAQRDQSGRWLSGDAATRDAFLNGLQNARALHFAGHGVADLGSSLSGGLLLADGMFTVGDALDCDLRKLELVVLSTGDIANASTDRLDEILTMPLALMRAGVSAVIAPQMVVSDQDAARIMTSLHALLVAGLEPWEALRQAQIAVRDDNWLSGDDFSDRYSWAAFICFGG